MAPRTLTVSSPSRHRIPRKVGGKLGNLSPEPPRKHTGIGGIRAHRPSNAVTGTRARESRAGVCAPLGIEGASPRSPQTRFLTASQSDAAALRGRQSGREGDSEPLSPSRDQDAGKGPRPGTRVSIASGSLPGSFHSIA